MSGQSLKRKGAQATDHDGTLLAREGRGLCRNRPTARPPLLKGLVAAFDRCWGKFGLGLTQLRRRRRGTVVGPRIVSGVQRVREDGRTSFILG